MLEFFIKIVKFISKKMFMIKMARIDELLQKYEYDEKDDFERDNLSERGRVKDKKDYSNADNVSADAGKKVKIDLKDKKILYELDKNSRQSFSQIGRKVRLSKEVVNYRIKRMEEAGIIKGYYTLINMSLLGYFTNRFFIKLKNSPPKKEKEIINYFVRHQKYWWVDSIDGFRDLGVASWEKSIKEAYKRREEFLRKYSNNVQELNESIYTGFYVYGRDYLIGGKKRFSKAINYIKSDIGDYTDFDLSLLRHLSNNARMSVVELATKLKSSVTVVNYRIRKLIKSGIIERFRVMIDLSRIGYYWYKVEFFLKDLGKKKNMLDYFAQNPNIVYAYETTADVDLEVEFEVESYEKFREILEDIRERFQDAIESYRHLLWFKEHKILFFPDD